jgi:hypothetical protein
VKHGMWFGEFDADQERDTLPPFPRHRDPSKFKTSIAFLCGIRAEIGQRKGPCQPRTALKSLLDGRLNYFCFVVSLFM